MLFFGRITEYKGLDILLKAFGILKHRYRWLKLRIVGAGNLRPYRQLLEELSDVEIVNHWVHEDQVWTHFQGVRLVVLPYTSASQSGVVALAAGFALPVVATKVGGIPEQIDAKKTGYLVDPGSVEQLVEALDYLLSNDRVAYQLGQNLLASHQQNRSWLRVSDMIYAICKDIAR